MSRIRLTGGARIGGARIRDPASHHGLRALPCILRRAASTAAAAAFAICLLFLAGSVSVSTALPIGSPGSSRPTALNAVSCVSATDCWAVGGVSNAEGITLNQAVHWNGATWSSVSVPEPGPFPRYFGDVLKSVDCVVSSDCWAVGGHEEQPEIMRWNGQAWSSVPSPKQRSIATLTSVSCVSANDCWAVGEGSVHLAAVLHWNGRMWSAVSIPEPRRARDESLDGISCSSSTECFAVGEYFSPRANGQFNWILRWNGSRWRNIGRRSPSDSSHVLEELYGISCSSFSACWAIGSYVPTGGGDANEALEWNGSRWSVHPTVPTSSSLNWYLYGISCAADTSCLVVGFSQSNYPTDLNQALTWDGTKWSGTTPPDPGGASPRDLNVLQGAACPAVDDCWAVGWTQPRNGQSQNEELHWNGTTWSANSS